MVHATHFRPHVTHPMSVHRIFVLRLNTKIKMKTLYVSLVLTMLLLLFVNTETKAKTGIVTSVDSAHTVESAKVLLVRLDEINAIDKSLLTRSETKALRKELRLIKGELKELHKGTYMPVGKLVVLFLVPFIIFNIAG